MKRGFSYSIIILIAVSCIAGQKSNSNGEISNFNKIEKPDSEPKQTISPTKDYVVYIFESSSDSGLTGGFSTVYVVRQKDNMVLLKENHNIQKVTWVLDNIVRFEIRPEVVKKTDQIDVFDFNVKTRKKTRLESEYNFK